MSTIEWQPDLHDTSPDTREILRAADEHGMQRPWVSTVHDGVRYCATDVLHPERKAWADDAEEAVAKLKAYTDALNELEAPRGAR